MAGPEAVRYFTLPTWITAEPDSSTWASDIPITTPS